MDIYSCWMDINEHSFIFNHIHMQTFTNFAFLASRVFQIHSGFLLFVASFNWIFFISIWNKNFIWHEITLAYCREEKGTHLAFGWPHKVLFYEFLVWWILLKNDVQWWNYLEYLRYIVRKRFDICEIFI
jgi:hypothetical protein